MEAEDEKALLVLLNKRCSELVDGKEALQVIVCQSSLKATCSVTCRWQACMACRALRSAQRSSLA